LQVTNPDQLEENRFQIKKLVMDLSMSELLRKNYTIEQILIEGVQTHVPRKHPGKRLVKAKNSSKKEVSSETSSQTEAGKSLDTYFAQANQWTERLGKSSDYLNSAKKTPKPSNNKRFQPTIRPQQYNKHKTSVIFVPVPT